MLFAILSFSRKNCDHKGHCWGSPISATGTGFFKNSRSIVTLLMVNEELNDVAKPLRLMIFWATNETRCLEGAEWDSTDPPSRPVCRGHWRRDSVVILSNSKAWVWRLARRVPTWKCGALGTCPPTFTLPDISKRWLLFMLSLFVWLMKKKYKNRLLFPFFSTSDVRSTNRWTHGKVLVVYCMFEAILKTSLTGRKIIPK